MTAIISPESIRTSTPRTASTVDSPAWYSFHSWLASRAGGMMDDAELHS